MISGKLGKTVDSYVEVSTELPSSAKKTATQKKSSNPEWNETLSVHVSETSELNFRVRSKVKLFEDSLHGQAKLKVSSIPRSDTGQCKLY